MNYDYKYYDSDNGVTVWPVCDWTKAYSLRPRLSTQTNTLIWFRYYYYDIHVSATGQEIKRVLSESEYVMYLLRGESIEYITVTHNNKSFHEFLSERFKDYY